MLCDQKQSVQQMIFNLYTTLLLTQIKGFSVMQFSWMLMQTFNKGTLHFLSCIYYLFGEFVSFLRI